MEDQGEIILCGTVHIDVKGSERFKKILEKEKPDVITIECAPEYLKDSIKLKNYIDKNKLLLKYGTRKIQFTPFDQSKIVKMNRDTLGKFFSAIHFEIITAKEYSDKNKIKLICIDKKEFVDEVNREIHKDLEKEVFYYFKSIPEEVFWFPSDTLEKFVENIYYRKNKKKISKENIIKLLERNKHAIKEILKLKGKKILHIGGVGHIFGNSPNMYEMLKEKRRKVRRLKLIEADNL